jgi:hypothetical protein
VIRPLPAVALAAVLALTGCASDPKPSAAPSPSAPSLLPTSAAPRNEVECVNVDRAYSAWASFRPSSAGEVAALNLGGVQREADKGKTFLDDVTGYSDQPSKVLASAVAAYNFEVSLGNLQTSLDGQMKAEQAAKIAAAGQKIDLAYQAWRTGTCT